MILLIMSAFIRRWDASSSLKTICSFYMFLYHNIYIIYDRNTIHFYYYYKKMEIPRAMEGAELQKMWFGSF